MKGDVGARLIAAIGSALLMVGTLLPFVTASTAGSSLLNIPSRSASENLWADNSGIILFILAGVSILLAGVRLYPGLLATSLLAIGDLIYERAVVLNVQHSLLGLLANLQVTPVFWLLIVAAALIFVAGILGLLDHKGAPYRLPTLSGLGLGSAMSGATSPPQPQNGPDQIGRWQQTQRWRTPPQQPPPVPGPVSPPEQPWRDPWDTRIAPQARARPAPAPQHETLPPPVHQRAETPPPVPIQRRGQAEPAPPAPRSASRPGATGIPLASVRGKETSVRATCPNCGNVAMNTPFCSMCGRRLDG